MHPYIIYGRRATGSVPVEAALLLLGVPHEVKEPARTDDPGDLSYEAMGRINPMQQLPALVLPSGEVMTESAAILVHLADSHPAARLAPAPADPRRPAFLRWMVFVSAQIYALAWARDDPMRLAATVEHAAVILARTAERRARCWRSMDIQVRPGRYLLGDELSVLDLYVTMVSRFAPGRARFYREAPSMAPVVRRIDQDPRLTEFWAKRFPLVDV